MNSSNACHSKISGCHFINYLIKYIPWDGFFNPLTRFLALRFMHPKRISQKNWLYNVCLDKTFPSSRNTSPILMQLSLFYSPLNSRSDGSNHQSLQGKSPLQQGLNLSFSFLFRVYYYTLVKIRP